ncbi:T9SS type A sorting domain-containing protein [Neolewinella aurantiaca]|uniref:T9SS type A sorting domain-containing protein n=1 Tax=Neolewinella aurantiaca TaxID=2602767 RepID=A0A5C7FXP4_9BACT|nr:T9SS type A sorting domain-containing protein [Neolewinella aurantiaca]TXF91239.1 T9SS type A sorting domain-containing protein [Neolewinella aurantiaca]
MTLINLRSLLPLCTFLLFSCSLQGQQRATDCINPTATAELDVNGVHALITNGGDLWFDGQNGRYEVTAAEDSPGENPVVAIFAGGLWLGAKDPGGGLKVAAQQYGRGFSDEGFFDYFPGPLTEDGAPAEGDCSDWDRLFKINRTSVDVFLAVYEEALAEGNLPIPANRIPLEVLGWPATGNPEFESVYGFALPDTPQGLAPFFDVDLDGMYNPRLGDYPLFCGDQAIWAVFNDAGAPHANSNTPTQLQAEIHLLAYAFASEDSVLHRTTFYEYTIINRGQEDALELYAGHWIDSDLGCFTNDLMGSSPEHELFYIYNQDGTDPETCEGFVEGYGNTAPVNIFQVVSSDVGGGNPAVEDPLMSSLMNVYNAAVGSPLPATTSPATSDEYYNYLTGRWRDGHPVTRSSLGYDTVGDTTLFVFDGGEIEDGLWRQCNVPAEIADVRQVYSTGPYNLQPGAVTSFTLAVTTIFGVDYPDGSCPDTVAIFAAAQGIKDFYDDSCTSSVLSDTNAPQSPQAIGLEVFPNPTAGELSFRLPGTTQISEIELLDATGRVVAKFTGTGHQQSVDLRQARLAPGLYLYRVGLEGGKTAAGRVVVL